MRGWVAALLVAGCDPVYHIDGTVLDPAGSPIAGVSVTKTCPSSPVEKETTDAAGHYAFGGVGGTRDADRCTLVFDKPGYKTQTRPSTAACLRSTSKGNAGEPCEAGEGNVTLAP